MIASRLRRRRPVETVTVYTKSVSGTYTETAAYTAAPVSHEQRDAFELMTDAGAVIMVTDVFWFEPIAGAMPEINEGQVIVNDAGTRFEVMQVLSLPYMRRVRAMTRRAR